MLSEGGQFSTRLRTASLFKPEPRLCKKRREADN